MFLLKKIFLLINNKLWFQGLINGVAANVELLILVKSIKKIKTLIDVGSNKGQFMLLLERYFPNIHMFSFEPIKEELDKSKKLFNKYNWPIIDVTRRSVEETAASILKIFEIQKNK